MILGFPSFCLYYLVVYIVLFLFLTLTSKLQGIFKCKNQNLKKQEQSPDLDWDVTKVLELLDWQFKITMTNMLVALMETSVQKQMVNVSRDGNSKIKRKC